MFIVQTVLQSQPRLGCVIVLKMERDSTQSAISDQNSPLLYYSMLVVYEDESFLF